MISYSSKQFYCSYLCVHTVCKECGTSFSLKGLLNKHIYGTHGKIRNHGCLTCKSAFADKTQLKQHEEAVHLKISDHVCEICGSTFSGKGNLRAHV